MYEKKAKDRQCKIIFESPYARKKIFLYYYNKHYDYIPCITKFLQVKHHCPYCLVDHNCKKTHKCKFTCTFCNMWHAPSEDNRAGIICNDCFRYFPDNQCFQNHKKSYREEVKLYVTNYLFVQVVVLWLIYVKEKITRCILVVSTTAKHVRNMLNQVTFVLYKKQILYL